MHDAIDSSGHAENALQTEGSHEVLKTNHFSMSTIAYGRQTKGKLLPGVRNDTGRYKRRAA